jgi:hypothetical protein
LINMIKYPYHNWTYFYFTYNSNAWLL